MCPSFRVKCQGERTWPKYYKRETNLYQLRFTTPYFHLGTEAMQWGLEVFDIFKLLSSDQLLFWKDRVS